MQRGMGRSGAEERSRGLCNVHCRVPAFSRGSSQQTLGPDGVGADRSGVGDGGGATAQMWANPEEGGRRESEGVAYRGEGGGGDREWANIWHNKSASNFTVVSLL